MDVRHGGELLNEEGPDVGCPRRATIDRNEVVLLFLRRLDRLSINGVDDRPQGGVGPEHEGGGHEAVERKPFAGQAAILKEGHFLGFTNQGKHDSR